MLEYLNAWWEWATHKGFALFGRYKPEYINNTSVYLALQVDELNNEVGGLLYSIGELERRHKDMSLIMIGLMMMSGEDEQTLKANFLQGIHEGKMVLDARNNEAGDVILKVLIDDSSVAAGLNAEEV